MNGKTLFLRPVLQPIARMLLAVSVTGFCYSAVAGDVVTDDQIRRVAKIAKATKTEITVTKERVTVTVHGDSKKMARKAKKTVSRIMRQKSYQPKQVSYSDETPDFTSQAPVLSNTRFRPPPRMNNVGNYRQPPVLDTQGAAPPALGNSGEDSGYY